MVLFTIVGPLWTLRIPWFVNRAVVGFRSIRLMCRGLWLGYRIGFVVFSVDVVCRTRLTIRGRFVFVFRRLIVVVVRVRLLRCRVPLVLCTRIVFLRW